MERIVLPIEPRGKGRPRFYNGHACTDAKTRQYERTLRELYIANGGTMHHGSITVDVTFTKAFAKGTPKRILQLSETKIIPWAQKCDIDNALKGLFDALNGVAWQDDKSITCVTARKIRGIESQIELCVKGSND